MMIEMYIFKGINLLLALGTIFMMTVFPIILLWYLLLQPTLEIRKKMKNGKTFKQVWKEVFKEDGSFSANTGTSQNHFQNFGSSHRLDDMNISSRYAGLPNNVFTNRR